MLKVRRNDALLVVDVQNDFCPQGALAVPGGDAVVPVINRLAARFSVVVATQDWHPAGHVSFAASHPGKKPFETVRVRGLEQVLWPVHCVAGTPGADFHPGLESTPFQFVIRKGTNPKVDSYSTFVENDRRTSTGLAGLLRELGVKRIFLAGLATDYCVLYSALDGLDAGFRVTVLQDACRGVDVPTGSVRKAEEEMCARGCRVLSTSDLG